MRRGLYAILLLLAPGEQDAVSRELMVVPAPRKVEYTTGEFSLERPAPIIISPQAGEWERATISEMQRFLEELTHRSFDIEEWGNQKTGILIGNPDRDSHVARRMTGMGLVLTSVMRAEGYVLGIDAQGVVIGAVSPAGLLYGTMTLRQMLETSPLPQTLPFVRIHDWPELQVRGISDDISRGQVSTMANFRKIIRTLAAFKLNTLFFYLQDMYRFEAYPSIGAGRGALTRGQVDSLEAYAALYNVEIIPVFEMLGHQPVLLLQPEYAHLAEFPGAHCFAINDETIAFLEGCVRELADVFDSPYLHAGLDESADLGYGKTEALVRQNGLGPVYADYYNTLNDIIRKHGKTMMMYSDIILDHPEIMDRIPANIIQMEWQYGLDPERFAHMSEFLAQDFTHITHSEIVNYHRFFPGLDLMREQVRRKIVSTVQQKDRGANVRGHVVASWGDQGGKGLRELNYYGYAFGSELMWSPEKRNEADFALHFMSTWYGPESAVTMRGIYDKLGRWPVAWDRAQRNYFRHPFAPRMSGHTPTIAELDSVETDARSALTLLEQAESDLRRHRDDIDYLRYAARSHLHYVQSQKLVRALQSIGSRVATVQAKTELQQRFLAQIDNIRSELVALRGIFEELWLRTNQPANLQYALNEYDWLTQSWDNAAARVMAGRFNYDPVLPEQWMYHPDVLTRPEGVQDAFFRKTFDVAGPIKRAHLQLYGDSHVVLYVNGQELGEQVARRNSTAPVNSLLVQVYDIGPYLRPGRNVLAVEAHKYDPRSYGMFAGIGQVRGAGVHIYGEIVDDRDRLLRIVADHTWKVSDTGPGRWTTIAYNDSDWNTAIRAPDSRYFVTIPDFTRNFPGINHRR